MNKISEDSCICKDNNIRSSQKMSINQCSYISAYIQKFPIIRYFIIYIVTNIVVILMSKWSGNDSGRGDFEERDCQVNDKKYSSKIIVLIKTLMYHNILIYQ